VESTPSGIGVYRTVVGDRTRRVKAPTVEPGMTPIAVVPRASTNEHAARKPLGAVITIRCAGIGVIRLVAVSADRRRTHNDRSDSYSNGESLGMRRSRN